MSIRAIRAIMKVVLIGDGAVGKTTLRTRFMGVGFKQGYSATVGCDFAIKRFMYKNNNATIQMWDMGGQQRFAKVRELYYRGLQAALLVYDVTNPSSFNNLPKWLDELLKQAGRVPIILCGNKIDLRDEVLKSITPEQGQEYAQLLSEYFGFEVPYIETSAKTGENISEPFHEIIDILFKQTRVKPKIKRAIFGTIVDEDTEVDYDFKIDWLENMDKRLKATKIWEQYAHLEDTLPSEIDFNKVLIQHTKQIYGLERKESRKKNPDIRIIRALDALSGKCYMLLSKQYSVKNEFYKFHDNFENGLNLYLESIFKFNLEARAKGDAEFLQFDLLLSILDYFYECIEKSTRLENLLEMLEIQKDFQRFIIEYESQFMSFIINCTKTIKTEDFELNKQVIHDYNQIIKNTNFDHPLRELVEKTYKQLNDKLPHLLVTKKDILPNPPEFKKPACIYYSLKNIKEEPVRIKLTVRTSQDEEFKEINSFKPHEEVELSFPIKPIEYSAIQAHFRIARLLEENNISQVLFTDLLQVDVKKDLLKPTDTIKVDDKKIEQQITSHTSEKEIKEKIRVLILASDPSNLPSLDQSDEVRLIENQLERREDLFEVKPKSAIRKKDLVDILTKFRPNIIHFIGHGNVDGELKLKEDDMEGEEDNISPKALARTFKLLKEQLQCVFLNACYTDETAEQIKNSADCVIGMTRAIDDRVAPYIAEGFYIGIRNGLNVEEAIEAGKTQAMNRLENLKDEIPELDTEIEKPKCIKGRKDPAEIYFVK